MQWNWKSAVPNLKVMLWKKPIKNQKVDRIPGCDRFGICRKCLQGFTPVALQILVYKMTADRCIWLGN